MVNGVSAGYQRHSCCGGSTNAHFCNCVHFPVVRLVEHAVSLGVPTASVYNLIASTTAWQETSGTRCVERADMKRVGGELHETQLVLGIHLSCAIWE